MSDSSQLAKTQARPWDRGPKETDSAWAAFQIYLALGEPGPDGIPKRRTLTQAARVLGHAGPAQLSEWSRRYGWRDRVAAYDHQFQLSREARVEEVLGNMSERHARLAGRVLDLVTREVERLEELQEDGMPIAENVRELAMLMEKGAHLERLARGQATEHHAHIHKADGEWDLENLSLEELEALADMQRKAAKPG